MLPKKIAHFLNDYAHDEFPSLNLSVSNGQHQELRVHNVQSLLARLRPVLTESGPAEISVYGTFNLGSTGRDGTQNISCYPIDTFYGFHRQVPLAQRITMLHRAVHCCIMR